MHICPIIVEEWSQGIVTTQHLLERHMFASNVRFAEPPKTLIIQVHSSFSFFIGILLLLAASLWPTEAVRQNPAARIDQHYAACR